MFVQATASDSSSPLLTPAISSRRLEIFFSNQLEVLYQQLKRDLFGCGGSPLSRRLVIVYGPAVKRWLELRFAEDVGVCFGIEWHTLGRGLDHLMGLVGEETAFPSLLELAVAIESELFAVVEGFEALHPQDRDDFAPLVRYLTGHAKGSLRGDLTCRMEKRLIALSEQLARLFRDYGRFAPKMIAEWERPEYRSWQPKLWRQVVQRRAPSRAFLQAAAKLYEAEREPLGVTVHLFSISYLTESELTFLSAFARHTPVFHYLLSPCALFWSDIRTDREAARLGRVWQKKYGSNSLEEFLIDRNPLLANFGAIGREMARCIEESDAICRALYVLPESAEETDEESFLSDDIHFVEGGPLTLLQALQADILLMRRPKGRRELGKEAAESLSLHVAFNKRREVEILYNNILDAIRRDPNLKLSDILVMAPRIDDYTPYIESVFGGKESQLDYRILDLKAVGQSDLVQGFFQLLHLGESRWSAADLLQLFAIASFQRRHALSDADFQLIRQWTEQAGILWGEDWVHRDLLLLRRHCETGMEDPTDVGTWGYGIFRLLMGTTISCDADEATETPPCSFVDFTQAELMGKWINLLAALRDDLSLFEDRTVMSMPDWAGYLHSLLESYLQCDREDEKSCQEWDACLENIRLLESSGEFAKGSFFSFLSVKAHLRTLFAERTVGQREGYLEAVCFCSLVPLRTIPAKVIAILGLYEGCFPRQDRHSSFNLMMGNKSAGYHPSEVQSDRYLFLEAIHSTQEKLLLSYPCTSVEEGKENLPSLLVEELFSYLDNAYSVDHKKISEACLIRHPHDAFDPSYFEREKECCGQYPDFLAAKSLQEPLKKKRESFIDAFHQGELKQASRMLEVRQLSAAMRNPIKLHLNGSLGIYVETPEERRLKTEEEFVVTALDKSVMLRASLKEPIERVLYRAEREGKLPLGLFKTVAITRLRRESDAIEAHLQRHGLDKESLFSLTFCPARRTPERSKGGDWIFPAPKVMLQGKGEVTITGTIPHASPLGLVVIGKKSHKELWKNLPQLYLFCHASSLLKALGGEEWKGQLLFSHTAQGVSVSHERVEVMLQRCVRYVLLAMEAFSPLLPDWIEPILEADEEGLERKMKSSFDSPYGSFVSKEVKWAMDKEHLPSAKAIIDEWREVAEELFSAVTSSGAEGER